ncbi:hypothetical protein LEMA_P038100.1 [Plenodomus lingam JN3]|uniref:Uncharacterized protein n=2 Tax=Leptosphaeria maculans TaxID=5022 RepID=E4ZRE2_LEPMJ|nr:hypothetical protein LEMA_P038100.1 [Plenodomus lingam JN3]CBX94136.1 hypothetical protein LEMA_P038100.1 [Plenodomus lingam JN3]
MTYEPDVEDGGTTGERTPMLGSSATLRGSSSHQRRSREASGDDTSKLWSVMRFFGGGIYAPDSSTYDPLEILLNTEDEQERDDLTVKWRDNKLSELSFVGVVSALLAGVLTSTGSWPNILPNGKSSPWPVRTSWYCGIILSLFSILTAADQTVRLHRLSSHRDGLDKIRKLLSKRNGERGHSTKTGRRVPSMLQIMTWQMPVMFLTTAAICMIVGMFLHVWSATTHLKHPEIWDDNTKVAIVYSIVAVTAVGLFFMGQVTLYSPARR